MRYAKHVFICTNERDATDKRGCCRQRGGEEVREALERKLKERGLIATMRANSAGCSSRGTWATE